MGPVTSKGDPCVWRLISQRLISDWKAGFIKVIEQKNKKNKNQYTIQYLSEGIIKKIKNGELPCYRLSNDPDVPTVEVEGYKTAGVNVPLIWSDKKNYTVRGSDEIREIFGDKSAFNYPKPTNLIKTIIKYVTSTDSVILDSFAGSGTTAHSVLELNKDDGGNRRFILVELGEYAEKITAERAKRIIKGYEGTESPVEGTGGSFSFYELGAPIILDGKINPDVPIETVKEFIYYLETKQAYKKDSDEKALLGVNSGCAYYFFYTPGKTVTLNRRKLSCIKTKAESYVIYADNCTLSDEELKNYNITFKKPGDIGRF